MNSEHITLYPVGGDPTLPQNFAEGSVMMVSQYLGPIDPSLTHVLQGEFKAVGPEASTVYFGLDCVTDLPVSDNAHDQRRCRDVDVFCHLESEATVIGYDPSSSTIQVSADTASALKVWNPPTTNCDKRCVAFYFDGNANRKPDYVHLYQAKVRGGYHSVDPEAGVIFLHDQSQKTAVNVLPDHVIERIEPNVTVVRHHFSSGTYLYLGPKGEKLEPGKWQFFSHRIKGEGFQNDPTKFRVGTKYVRVFILANWRQPAEMTLLFRNISFTQMRAYRFIKDGTSAKKIGGPHRHNKDQLNESEKVKDDKRKDGSYKGSTLSSTGVQVITPQVSYPYDDSNMSGLRMSFQAPSSPSTDQKYTPALQLTFVLPRPAVVEVCGVFTLSNSSAGLHAILSDKSDQLVSQNSVYIPRASSDSKVHYPMTWITKELPAGEHSIDMKVLVVGDKEKIHLNQTALGEGLNNVVIKLLN